MFVGRCSVTMANTQDQKMKKRNAFANHPTGGLYWAGMEALFPLESSWIAALAAGVIALIMLLRLARSLPGQNILMIAAGLLVGEGSLELLQIQISQITVTGPLWCYLAGAALLWLAVVLSSRRLAQFILRPWRAEHYYGIWLITASAVITALFQFGWPCLNAQTIGARAIDSGLAAGLAAIRGAATAILLVCLTPWLIRKRPYSRAARLKLAQQPKDQTQQKADEQTSS